MKKKSGISISPRGEIDFNRSGIDFNITEDWYFEKTTGIDQEVYKQMAEKIAKEIDDDIIKEMHFEVKAQTSDQGKACVEIAKKHGYGFDDSGGWVYNFTTQKYLDHNAEWVDDVIDNSLCLPEEELEWAREELQKVYPDQQIIIVLA